MFYFSTFSSEVYKTLNKRWIDETWRGFVCLGVCTGWALVIGRPEIMWRENWISPEDNRMRMLMSLRANVWEVKTNAFSPFVFPPLSPPFSLPRPFFFPSCFPSFIPLSVTWRVPIHPSPCSSITPISSHRPSSNCCRLSRDACLSRLILSPAEEEDHHHLRGGEEVSAQVHHRSEGQHPAGDPGDYGGVGGDAPSWLQLGDHHPQGGARQAGTGAHAGVRQGEEEEEEGERMMERVTVRPNVLFLLGSERGRFQRGCEFYFDLNLWAFCPPCRRRAWWWWRWQLRPGCIASSSARKDRTSDGSHSSYRG